MSVLQGETDVRDLNFGGCLASLFGQETLAATCASKHYYGTSANAVKTQIYIEVGVYLLLTIIHKELDLLRTGHTTLQLLSVRPFGKMSF